MHFDEVYLNLKKKQKEIYFYFKIRYLTYDNKDKNQ
jgi:hypothetical protein